MPRPWTGNKPLFVRLTAAEIELLKQEKAQKKLYSLSAALEKAVCSMLHEVDLEQRKSCGSCPKGQCYSTYLHGLARDTASAE